MSEWVGGSPPPACLPRRHLQYPVGGVGWSGEGGNGLQGRGDCRNCRPERGEPPPLPRLVGGLGRGASRREQYHPSPHSHTYASTCTRAPTTPLHNPTSSKSQPQEYFEAFCDGERLCVVTELMLGGDLAGYLRWEGGGQRWGLLALSCKGPARLDPPQVIAIRGLLLLRQSRGRDANALLPSAAAARPPTVAIPCRSAR